MNKILPLFLLSNFLISEEIKYPIELTCTGGVTIVDVSISKETDWYNDKASWIKVRQSRFFKEKNINRKFDVRIDRTDKFTYIIAKKTGFSDGLSMTINNYTLSSEIVAPLEGGEGQCYIGFREFTKQI